MWNFGNNGRSVTLIQTDGGATVSTAAATGWRAATARRSAAAGQLIALAMAVGLPMSAGAQQTAWADTGAAPLENGPTPSAINALPYVRDPSYNNGRTRVDTFPGGSSNDYYGRKIVQLDDGSVIVAGVVPPTSGGSNPVNLGLVRYLPDGSRATWSNPAGLGHNANQYLVYPDINTSAGHDHNIIDVRDMKVYGDRLFVLVNSRWSATDIDTEVLVFSLTGQFMKSTRMAFSDYNDFAGGIVVYGNRQFPETISIAYAGYMDAAGVYRPEFFHGTVHANGSIQYVTRVRPNPGNYCPVDRSCMLTSISGGLSPGGTARFYVAGTRYAIGAADTDFLVMALAASGSPRMSFGGSGVTTVPFNRGGALSDSVNKVVSGFSLHAPIDEIYLVGDVSQACKTGVGVAKLTGTGKLDFSFGDPQIGGTRSGKRVIGGSVSTYANVCGAFGAATYSYDAALQGSKLGIASTTFSPRNAFACLAGQPCAETGFDGSIIVLDSVTGDTASFASYPYTDVSGGARTRHSSFIGIAATGDGRFTVAGAARYFEAAPGRPVGKSRYASLRVKPEEDGVVRNDSDSN